MDSNISHWNHRVLRRTFEYDCEKFYTYNIHEVYYEDGEPYLLTEKPVHPSGESIGELRDDLERMIKSLDAPILNWEDFDKDE